LSDNWPYEETDHCTTGTEGRCWTSLEGGNREAYRGGGHRLDDYRDLSVFTGATDGMSVTNEAVDGECAG
jgi:hypothetical protein